MQKILFIENRHATRLYESISRRLVGQDVVVHWIVQNPVFKPGLGTAHFMPPPCVAQLSPPSEAFKDISRSDRGVRFFGGTDEHYEHYAQLITGILQKLRPDVVFGEQTQFHELLTIRICRSLEIPFLSPNATRFPPGRFSFFAHDTMHAVGGSGETLSDEQAAEVVHAISCRRLAPFTNASAELEKPPTTVDRLRQKTEFTRIVAGWLRGERFITPSPWRKFTLNKQLAEGLRWWESEAVRRPPDSLAAKPWVLFPLQMQPETNLDVWGQPWNDQAEIIRRGATALQKIGGTLVVKPNPTSKYELLGPDIRQAMALPNVVRLSHGVAMHDIFAQVPLVLAVTGTVQLECLFSGKPVAVLGEHQMSFLPGISKISTPEDLVDVAEEVMAGRGKTASHEQKIRTLQDIYRSSYRGYWFDPISSPAYFEEENMAALARAFTDQLQSLARKLKPGVSSLAQD